MATPRKVAVARSDLFLDRLPQGTRRALERASTIPLFQKPGWYLGGGTALALQVGHRQSVDLDFFISRASFNEVAVSRELLISGAWVTAYEERGTIYGTLEGAKMSLIAYPFFVPKGTYRTFGTIRILGSSDIAAMKIIAISQRGRKRDFIDLYWYAVNREPLSSVIKRAVTQYPRQKHNLPHFIKSLCYFADAEADPMPRIFFSADWEKVKKFFKREAERVARELLGLDG